MKKIFVLLAALSVFMFTGCFDPVFNNIEKEVRLTQGSVPGSINSVVRFNDSEEGEVLVTSNGAGVFYKKAGVERTGTESVWTLRENDEFQNLSFDYYTNQFLGKYITKVAADSSYIYILAAELKDDGTGENSVSAYHLYYTEKVAGSTWNEIKDLDSFLATSLKSASIFCTNSVSSANRSAYIRCFTGEKYVYYKLGTAPVEVTSPVMGDGSTYDNETTALNAVLSTSSGVVFFTGTAACEGDGCYYYVKYDSANSIYDTDICMKKDGEDPVVIFAPRTSGGNTSGNAIMSLAVTKDSILYGCGNASTSTVNDGGLFRIELSRVTSETLPLTSYDSFSTNGSATITSLYQVRCLLVEDPAKGELDTNIYAGISFKTSGTSVAVSYENKGLWAYYPTRGNWNRE